MQEETKTNLNISERVFFSLTQEESDAVHNWAYNHLREKHFLTTPEMQSDFNIANNGAYSVTFSPTAIGMRVECSCNVCAKAAFRDARGDMGVYRENLAKDAAYMVVRNF